MYDKREKELAINDLLYFFRTIPGADLSFYLMIFICVFGYFVVKSIRHKIEQYRYERENRIEEMQKAELARKEMEQFEKEQIAHIKMEDFWYGK
ncbi:hypothetical protein [Enterococcus viikkiensis]|uniref:hypothetical protein n=1 Tax=Enterococcus viikkiensis TaxID=930854 RepID=UPI0010F5185F|nr:hypothetical protein [Enterococcus viikkiensis]